MAGKNEENVKVYMRGCYCPLFFFADFLGLEVSVFTLNQHQMPDWNQGSERFGGSVIF